MKKMFWGLCLGFSVFSLSAETTYYVDAARPNDSGDGRSWATAKKTIQAAIGGGAGSGDELVVAPGTYSAIDTQGKPITIRSEVGPNRTFLTTGTFSKDFGVAWGIGRTVKFAALLVSDADTAIWGDGGMDDDYLYLQWTDWDVTEFQHSTLIGFTILRDGVPGDNECFSVNGGKLINCIFKDTNIHAAEAVNCLFVCPTRNDGELVCDSRLVNCTVVVGGSNDSSEIYCSELLNTIVYALNAKVEVAWSSSRQPRMLSSICYNVQQFIDEGGSVVDLSGVQQVDPQFSNLSGGDYTLSRNSSCINAGTNPYVSGTTDLDGNPRIVGGQVDIGCYEFSPLLYQLPLVVVSVGSKVHGDAPFQLETTGGSGTGDVTYSLVSGPGTVSSAGYVT